ncbi:MAG: trypsin-like peptidase domain-containing protein [Lachnospiraceae bacterium]|nr:trypsin-like peptidase domain-containing protein [Lachnospiraceae bacterium]
MYENNYPNQYENTNTYHYTTENSHIPKEPEKPKKSGGAGKKIALGICCGLLFGVFAGLGFTAVTTASEFLIETSGLVSESEKPEDEEDRKEDVENDAGDGEEVKEEPEDSGIAQASVPQAMITDVTEVVKAVMPSVVSVNNKYIETTSFFGQQYSSEGNSSGSGIIVGENETELLLVTNYHVVEEAEELSVQFCDGSQAQAQMKGSDRHKDLAVIAVQIEDIDEETKNAIAIATLGDSTQLTVGEPVIAIGNALGYGQSVTTGVVSALNRPIGVDMTVSMEEQEGDEEINTFIQTDAAINPGNSGGALLNIKGEVIGINSNKIGGTAVEGMGYAIPISDAHPIIENLMARETKLRVDEEKQGYLGITGIDVVAEYSEIYGMPMGVYVSSVSEGTGAHKAGLVRGDVITAVNDQEISSMVELKEELTYYAAGDTVELTIMQGSPTGYQAKKVSVTLSSKELMEQ